MTKRKQTIRDLIKVLPEHPDVERLAQAIEDDKKQAIINERLHPLKDYPNKPFYAYPFDPSA